MFRSRRFALLSIALAVGLGLSTGCSDDGDNPLAPAGSRVITESARAATETVGPAGGTVVATGSNGVTYTLTIPQGALATALAITVTPITAIDGLPLSAGLAGAVALEPSGLLLIKPATLALAGAVAPVPPAGAAAFAAGFAFTGDAAAYELAPLVPGASPLTVLVSHFSGAGVAGGATGEATAPAFATSAGTLAQALLALPAGATSAQFLDFMRDHLTTRIVPGIDGESGDALRLGVIRYMEWLAALEAMGPGFGVADPRGALATEIASTDALVSAALLGAIAVLKQRCEFADDVTTLHRLFEFQLQAEALNLAGEGTGLHVDEVIEGLCATAVVADSALVDPLPLGQDYGLDVTFALDVNGTRLAKPFNVSGVVLGGTMTPIEGRSDASGGFSAVVRRTEAAGMGIYVGGTLLLPLFSAGSTSQVFLTEVPLRAETRLFRGAGTIEGAFPAIVAAGSTTPLEIRIGTVYDNVFTPIDGAVVSVQVSGGSAAPTVLSTDAQGLANTTISAGAGASELRVEVVARRDSQNGPEIARRTYMAAVGVGTPAITALSRTSFAFANVGPFGISSNWCPPATAPDSSGTADFNVFSASHGKSITCDNPNAGPMNASSTCTANADPGFAQGAPSATILVTTSQTLAVTGQPSYFMSASAGHDFVLRFRIEGASAPFTVDAQVGGTVGYLDVNLRQEGGATVYDISLGAAGEGPFTQQASGLLAPGTYVFTASRGASILAAEALGASADGTVRMEIGSGTGAVAVAP